MHETVDEVTSEEHYFKRNSISFVRVVTVTLITLNK